MDDEALVTDLDRAWNEAYVLRERERLRDVLAEDWLGVLPNGETVTREQLIAADAPPDLKVEQIFSDFSLHLFGTTAVATGRVEVTAGDKTIRQRFLRVYAKRESLVGGGGASGTVRTGLERASVCRQQNNFVLERFQPPLFFNNAEIVLVNIGQG